MTDPFTATLAMQQQWIELQRRQLSVFGDMLKGAQAQTSAQAAWTQAAEQQMALWKGVMGLWGGPR